MGVVQFLWQQEQQTCQASHDEHGQGLPPALLFLAYPGKKATAFLPAAQSNWLALHLCSSCHQGFTKRRWWLRWEPAQDLVSQGNPVNICCKSPPGLCPSCGRAQQLNAQLLWLAREHNSEGGGEDIFLLCHTNVPWVRLCTDQALSHSVACSYSLIMVAGNEELDHFKHKQKAMHFKCALEVGIFPSHSLSCCSLQARTVSAISQGLWSKG